MLTYWAEHAWLDGEPAEAVAIETDAGRVRSVATETEPRGEVLRGLVLPGLANAHSHAFHRALRGRADGGAPNTFWGWREGMYAMAGRLDPDSYYRLARAVYAEMALSGITCVGEFHYLHHTPAGRRYADPNAMGHALVAAAADAGIRITLLDALYLSGGFGAPLDGVQRRFGDGTLDAWMSRLDRFTTAPHALLGTAVHSVRAVPGDVIAAFACSTEGRPVHVHLSEQPAENEACHAEHGCSPTELLERRGLLGPDLTAVHCTHPEAGDLALLADAGATVCLCPTTERELADGIGPAGAMADAGIGLSLGTDSNTVIDMFEEARAVEMHERLATGRRGRFATPALLEAAARHDTLGWDDAGAIAPGMRADLVALALDTPRTAGAEPAAILAAATAADVTDVIVDGRRIVADGRHTAIDTAAELSETIGELWA